MPSTTTRTRKALKAGRSDGKPPAPLYGEAAAESEMVTLERIDNQKKHLLANCYFKKAGTAGADGSIQVKSQTLLFNDISMGLKSRFTALLALIEGPLEGKIKHFTV